MFAIFAEKSISPAMIGRSKVTEVTGTDSDTTTQ